MIFDVYYYRNGRPLADYDRGVGERYVSSIPSSLRPGETAFAKCLTDPRHSLEIDCKGVHKPVADDE